MSAPYRITLINKNVPNIVARISTAVSDFNINIDDVALFIPHQITKYLTLKTCEVLGLPIDRTVDIIGDNGNIGCSSIPLAIAKNIESGRIKLGSGQQIVIFGFGNGVSMALMSLYI